jgi:hypothetical protein
VSALAHLLLFDKSSAGDTERADIRKAVGALLFFERLSICGFSIRQYSEERRTTPMPQFVLMLRDTGFPDNISPEEIQAIIERYRSWKNKVHASGQKLHDGEGRVVTRKEGGVAVTDGPFVEAKEVIGGYFIVTADDYAAAEKLVEDCPHLDYGSIEIRRIEMA